MELTNLARNYNEFEKREFDFSLNFSSQSKLLRDIIIEQGLNKILFLNLTDKQSAHKFIAEISLLVAMKDHRKEVISLIYGHSPYFNQLANLENEESYLRLGCRGFDNADFFLVDNSETLPPFSFKKDILSFYFLDFDGDISGLGQSLKYHGVEHLKEAFLILKNNCISRDEMSKLKTMMKYLDLDVKGIISLSNKNNWWEFWK